MTDYRLPLAQNMSTTYAIIDVETTGLDPQNDALIEVAAIILRDNDILEEYSTLINPHRDIPEFITQLTGITNDMVSNAPSMFTVRPKLRDVIGDCVLVGHSVGFDAAFLAEERVGLGNHRIDTVTLASILVPEAGRYSLEALVAHLDLPDPHDGQTHRALDDAEQTVELLLALRERALALDMWQLEEIVMAGKRIAWPETLFFEEMLAHKAQFAFSRKGGKKGNIHHLFNPEQPRGQALAEAEKPEALPVAFIAGMLEPGGNFDHTFPNFEHRPQQVEMLTAVTEAFNHGDQTIIEAGTGTGKSIAYLLPAAFWAHQNGRRVVVSTNTINLQDQLIHKDLPELQKALPFTLQTAVRKGRSNYLCTRLFKQLRHNGPSNADDMIMFARVLLWLPTTNTGDVSELVVRTPGERLAWGRMNGENTVCTNETCTQERCPRYIAQRRAEQAHIVIVNHSLLLANISSGNHILPHFKDLILDEAHHLETAVTDGLSFRADKRLLQNTLSEITQPKSGILGQLESRARGVLPPEIYSSIQTYITAMRNEAQEANFVLEEFFATIGYFLKDHVNRRSQFSQQVRLVPSIRSLPEFNEVELSWENLNNHLKVLGKAYEKLSNALEDVIYNHDIQDGEDLVRALSGNGRELEETRQNLNQTLVMPQAEMIYWAEHFKDRISLHSAPLNVGTLVEEHIFEKLETVILTSATMRTAGAGSWQEATFDYIRSRLHAYETTELAVGSPFDYENSVLLYLASDMPEPNQPGYQHYLENAITDVALALGGRTMVLFTSYSQLNKTAKAIEHTLTDNDIITLAQGGNMSRQQLLAQFKQEGNRAVLLGTRSFWEGVDVPGDALQCVIITKLPFDVPSDPIFAARSETFDNSFFEYSVPEAILRFRQGFGRLVRRGSDEGVVVILDKRVLSKRYGKLFLDALPPCMVLRQRTNRLGELTIRWLNRER
ncbi:MAG: DNA polymerase III subunit epsilon [Chloroflexi bacterium]|nr:MAG: DNA polymerase III subunit epsilon [Chloroflexota bacterium]